MTLRATDKTIIMVFKGKQLVRSKIEIDGSILEQVKQFNIILYNERHHNRFII